jgi:hypothetical protein
VEAEHLNQARSVLCGGRPVMGVLTAIRSTDAQITEPRRLDIKARQCEAALMSKEVRVCVQCGLYVLVELLMAQIDARPQD